MNEQVFMGNVWVSEGDSYADAASYVLQAADGDGRSPAAILLRHGVKLLSGSSYGPSRLSNQIEGWLGVTKGRGSCPQSCI